MGSIKRVLIIDTVLIILLASNNDILFINVYWENNQIYNKYVA
jgi:hypothetical protein